MSARECVARLAAAAGRELDDDTILKIFERVQKAALDIKAGRISPDEVTLGKRLSAQFDGDEARSLVQQAAAKAANDLKAEASLKLRQANLQIAKMGASIDAYSSLVARGVKPLDAMQMLIAREYKGISNIESIEQRAVGWSSALNRRLLPTWEALGNDFLGLFQDRVKQTELIKELRGEDTGNILAKKGAKAFLDTAEQARVAFNAVGGNVKKLMDWALPQHHSQQRIAVAGRDAWLKTLPDAQRVEAIAKFKNPPQEFSKQFWIDSIIPLLDKSRYLDDVGMPMSDVDLNKFLTKAWENITTDGLANVEPGGFRGAGKFASRHAESRQIHFKDAESLIKYWEQFGDKSAVEILHGHIDSMARDIAFIEKFGPNQETTYKTLRDMALKTAVKQNPSKTNFYKTQANRLDRLWNYSSGKTSWSANQRFSNAMDTMANLNVAGKLGGSAIASLIGDKPMMEAVSHLNNMPAIERWRNELMLLNPMNKADRALLQQNGLMLESVRSGINRFYEGLGKYDTSGKIANAVMRVTGMQAINDIRKGSFGLTLMSAIGRKIADGVDFGSIHKSDVRTLRNYGIEQSDWDVWKLAELDDLGHGNDRAITPDAISRIPDKKLIDAGFSDPEAARNNAIVKLLGAVNTESEFAIVTPGWKERAAFYGGYQRGTFLGEITRSVLQFKSFPWAYFQRSMDLIANQGTPASKAAAIGWVISTSALAGAMLLQTREILSGKDPRKMWDDPSSAAKFWGAAFLQGGALGPYGDFLYSSNQTRYGTGVLEMMAGPSVGPLLEVGLTGPMKAIRDTTEGKETHLGAMMFRNLKGFVPGQNIWYLKAGIDHLIWQQAAEAMSPGYLRNIKRRTRQEYGQDFWWQPGDLAPSRAPDLTKAFETK